MVPIATTLSAGVPPVGVPPADSPPAGVPPADSPPADSPPVGVPPADSPPGLHASGSPASGLVTSEGTVDNINNTVCDTTSRGQEGVSGVPVSAPQSLLGCVSDEADLELGHQGQDTDTEGAMSEDDAGSDKPEPDLMDRAASLMDDLVNHLISSREAAIVLPRANPVIPLIQEIAVKAQFPLSERIPQEEGMVEFVHVGTEGPWSDLATTSSCEELSKILWSQPPDTDNEDALVLDLQVVDGDEDRQSSQDDARPSLEVIMAPARPRTAPSHPYRPPQITEVRGEWYGGEDCFDPEHIAPSSSPQLVPSPDGGLNWGGDEAMPPFKTDRPPFRGRSIQRVYYYSRTNPGPNGKRPKMSGEARQDRCGLASAHFQREVFWQQAVRDYQYYSAVDDSPINFFPPGGYGEGLKAVPYSLLVPLALEVPYLDGLAQEALSDRLIPASLYGLTVMRPAYTAEAVGPKSITVTKTAVDWGQAHTEYIIDGDVEVQQDHDCYVGRSPQC